MKKMLLLALVLVMLAAIGCTPVEEPDREEIPTVEVVIIEDLDREDVIDWYQKHFKIEGTHQYSSDEEPLVEYLLISYGEIQYVGAPLALYGVQEEAEILLLRVGPSEPFFVSPSHEGNSYPHILLRVRSEEGVALQALRAGLEYRSAAEVETVESFKGIHGVFNGWADSNVVEIDLDDVGDLAGLPVVFGDPQAFWVSEEVKPLLMLDEGTRVAFDFELRQEVSLVITGIQPLDGIELSTLQGIYIGRIDSSSVEVLTEDGYEAFRLDQDGLEDYTALTLAYSVNENGQKVIEHWMPAEPPWIDTDNPLQEGVGTVTREYQMGIFEIDGEVYWEAAELLMLSSYRILEGDTLTFSYYQDAYGRKVIVEFQPEASK